DGLTGGRPAFRRASSSASSTSPSPSAHSPSDSVISSSSNRETTAIHSFLLDRRSSLGSVEDVRGRLLLHWEWLRRQVAEPRPPIGAVAVRFAQPAHGRGHQVRE